MDGIFQGKNRAALDHRRGDPRDRPDPVVGILAQGDQDNVGKGIGGGIRGAGQCQVMVTLENGVEYVYASQQKVNTDRTEDTASDSNKISQRDGTEQNIIIVDTDNGRQGLLVTEIQPTVKGVVVVCEGGDLPQVQQRIIEAVTTALNISSKRVCVTKSS